MIPAALPIGLPVLSHHLREEPDEDQDTGTPGHRTSQQRTTAAPACHAPSGDQKWPPHLGFLPL